MTNMRYAVEKNGFELKTYNQNIQSKLQNKIFILQVSDIYIVSQSYWVPPITLPLLELFIEPGLDYEEKQFDQKNLYL